MTSPWVGQRRAGDAAHGSASVGLLGPAGVNGDANDTAFKLVVMSGGSSQVAAVTDIDFSDDDPGLIAKSLMMGGLEDWLNVNLHVFTHVFSVVDLNMKVDHEQFAWLMPTSVSYAYIDGNDDASSHLGVLCMTDGRDSSELAAQISPNAIPPGSRSGFLISKDRILEKMLLPAMPMAFSAATAADFGLATDGSAIVNRHPIKTATVHYAGMEFQPVIQELSVKPYETDVIVEVIASVNIGLGVTAYVKTSAAQRLKLVTTPDKKNQTLTWENARPTVSDHWTVIDPGATIIESIIAAVVTVIITILTDGADLVIALIILALVVGLLEVLPQQISDTVAKIVTDGSPPFTLLALNATAPIRWSGAQSFALDWAGLNGSLQMGGNPQFVS